MNSSKDIPEKTGSKYRAVSRRNLLLAGTTLAAAPAVGSAVAVKTALAQQQSGGRRPNILVIFGDDIGMWNVGAYCNGMMGRTPNIDRIAKEGILFTDHYGQPSCTAGRAAFIMGQLPVRTGMTTVGIPGSTRGIQKSDPTLAEVLKAEGYATAQFGKNHLGDRNEFLPTVHGFDYWFGNLYHLNAEEEPEELDYPGQKNPQYKQRFGPRGVLRGFATDVDDPTTDPKFGRVGKQKIEDAGPLTRKRMETIDSEVLGETLKWMDTNGKGDKPFFVWFNSTAIHNWSHPTQKYIQMAVDEGRAEEDVVRARMLEHDERVGALRMDPMEKMDPESHEWGYAGRKFVAEKFWAPTAAGPFLAAHLQSLNEFPPSQRADTLSMKKAVNAAMEKVSKHVGE
jgi:arylsulfatase